MLSDQSGISVCLLLDGETVPKWQAKAIETLLSETDATIDLVVINEAEETRSTAEKIRRAIELREWAAVAIYRELFEDSAPRIPVSRITGIGDPERISCEPETVDGWKNALPDEIEDRIVEETDVAIRFGFGFLVGDLLEDLDHGVLSYHHGDLTEYRGQPMGFWEFVHGRDTAGVTVQRISDKLDAGEIIYMKHVDISDAACWGDVRARLFDASEDMLAESIKRLQAEEFSPAVPDDLGELYSHPRGSPVLKYCYLTARKALLQ